MTEECFQVSTLYLPQRFWRSFPFSKTATPAALTLTSVLPASTATLPSTISPRSRSRSSRPDGFTPCAVVETSAGNFQAWLKHPAVFPKLLGTFAAQTLAGRYNADASAADWRRFGRLPGFTNCKPKYKKPDGLFPFVRLKIHNGEQYPTAEAFGQEITKLYEAREQEREAKRLQASPQRGPMLSTLSLERFRDSSKYRDRPAAADIAFCVAAYAIGMDETRMERALEDDYLSRDPSLSKRASYIRRTMTKARGWAIR